MLNMVRLVSLLVISSSVVALSAQSATASTLTVGVDGLRKFQGQVCLSVFGSSQGFPMQTGRAIHKQCAKATGKRVVVKFGNLKPGNYAIAVLHDANNDNQANRNALGIPTEGFGFSQNPQIIAGPPKFADASFVVRGSNTQVQIQLQYLFGR